MSHHAKLVFTVLGAVVCAAPLCAQTVAPKDPAAVGIATISEAEYRAKLEALAHDSTMGRETPSPELEKAAAWIAEQFKHAGLSPGGSAGTFFQPFELAVTRLDTATTVVASCAGAPVSWRYGEDIIFVVGGEPVAIDAAPVVLLRGLPAEGEPPFGNVAVDGRVIVQTVPADKVSGRFMNPIHRAAQAGGALAHIIVTDLPDEMWTQFRGNAFPQSWNLVGGTGQPDEPSRLAIYGLQRRAATEFLRAAGEDPATVLGLETSDIRELEGFTLTLTPHYTVLTEHTVANVVGFLRGSDPALRHEAVVFSSHMDHVGLTSGRCRGSQEAPADSICNGADDNASGTVGIIELAEAFAALPTPPARSLVFAAMAAEERGLFGSYYYVKNPLVPIANTAAVINLDMIARNPADTVGFAGKDYSSLGALIDRLTDTHPELRLTPTEHEGIYWGSDHYPFARRAVPALFFFSGIHQDLHRATDDLAHADTDQATRIVRLAFLAGLEVANAPDRPTWDPKALASVTGESHD